MIQPIPNQRLGSPKNMTLDLNAFPLLNNRTSNAEPKPTADQNRQKGSSIDAIKKLIKNSYTNHFSLF